MLLTKAQGARGDQHRRRRQLAEKPLRGRHNEAAVAAGYWMGDLITLRCVEKQHVVCIRNCLLTANVAGVHTSVGKDQVRGGRALLSAAMAVRASALHVAHAHQFCSQEAIDFELGHLLIIALSSVAAHAWPIRGTATKYLDSERERQGVYSLP